MLSYQHAYHAGNPADVHKHALLSWTLDYLAQKPKPLTYIETHAGRALYDLASPEARKTGEAAAGIGKAESRFPADHPYLETLAEARSLGGSTAYPGSPLIARTLLRPEDRIILAERHPAEVAALRATLPGVDIRATDGLEMANAITPPSPRRGLMLVDPSYELASDYAAMPALFRNIHRKWPVGVLMLWYPVLTSKAERPMVLALKSMDIPSAVLHEHHFPPARPGHGMIGSGLYVINPPWGFAEAAATLVGWLKA